jgi:hypothetical protein
MMRFLQEVITKKVRISFAVDYRPETGWRKIDPGLAFRRSLAKIELTLNPTWFA